MNLKHMWFTLTENSFNNWYNISRELKWLSLVTSSFQTISLHCWPTFILSCSSRSCSAGKAHWRKRRTCVSQKKRSFGCSHDNSLMSRFLPPSEPLEPVHLRKYVSKRKPEKLFKKWCIIYLYFFLLLAACGKTVLCETCVLNLSDHSSNALALATCLFSMKSTLFFFTHTASCSESRGSLQNLYRAL